MNKTVSQSWLITCSYRVRHSYRKTQEGTSIRRLLPNTTKGHQKALVINPVKQTLCFLKDFHNNCHSKTISPLISDTASGSQKITSYSGKNTELESKEKQYFCFPICSRSIQPWAMHLKKYFYLVSALYKIPEVDVHVKKKKEKRKRNVSHFSR